MNEFINFYDHTRQVNMIFSIVVDKNLKTSIFLEHLLSTLGVHRNFNK